MSLRFKKFLIIFAGVAFMFSGALANIARAENLTATEVQATVVSSSALEMIECGGIFSELKFSCIVPGALYYGIYMPAMGLLTLSGYIFDFMIALSIDRDFIKQDFVNTTWTIVRDFSNMIFIFILLYTGILTIFGMGKWQDTVTKVVIIALIINFSMFFTNVVIDAGNVLAVGVYSGMGVIKTTDIDKTHKSGGIPERNLSATLVNAFAPQQFMEMSASNGKSFAATIFVIAAIVSLYVAYIFFKAAFLFMGRIIAFWFYIIISPYALVSMTLPKGKGNIYDSWLSGLLDQAFVAPIFLFFVYLIMKAIEGGTKAGTGIFTSLATSGTGFFDKAFVSIVITGMIIYALQYALSIAKSKSGSFGEIGAKLGNQVLGIAGAVAGGGTAMVGRQVVGGLAQKALTSDRVKELEEKVRTGTATFVERQMFKAAVRTTDVARNATLDFRNIPIPGVFGGGTVGKAVGLGEGGRQGYREAAEARRKRKEDREPSKIASEARIAEMTAADSGVTAREAQEKKEVAAVGAAAERQARRDVPKTHAAGPSMAATKAAYKAPGAAKTRADAKETKRLDKLGIPPTGTPPVPSVGELPPVPATLGYVKGDGLYQKLEEAKAMKLQSEAADVGGMTARPAPTTPDGWPPAHPGVPAGTAGALKAIAEDADDLLERAKMLLAADPSNKALMARVAIAKSNKIKADKDLDDFKKRQDSIDELEEKIEKLANV